LFDEKSDGVKWVWVGMGAGFHSKVAASRGGEPGLTRSPEKLVTFAEILVSADDFLGLDSITTLAAAIKTLMDRKSKDGCDYGSWLLEVWVFQFVTLDEALKEVPGSKGESLAIVEVPPIVVSRLVDMLV